MLNLFQHPGQRRFAIKFGVRAVAPPDAGTCLPGMTVAEGWAIAVSRW
jgi:hypothetical protein